MRVVVFILVVIVLGCTKEIEYPHAFPLLVTDSVTNITSDGATLNAHIINDVTSTITSYGFEWVKVGTPQVNGRVEIAGAPSGKSYSCEVRNNLTKGQQTLKAFAKTGVNTIYGPEISFVSLGSAPAVITSFTPTEGIDGTEVTLNIENFTFDAGNTSVTIQTIPVAIISGSNTQLKIKIPATALIGKFPFTIKDIANTSQSSGQFKIAAPTIVSISKTTFRVGERITFSGEYFGSALNTSIYFGNPQQYFSGNVATYEVISPTQMDVYVPDYFLGSQPMKVHIHSQYPGGPVKTATFPTDVRILNSWNAVSATTPVGNVEGYKAVTIGDLIYVVGGKVLYTFNPTTKEWTKKADFPGLTRVYGAAFESGGKLYFGFGEKDFNSVKYNDIWVYDPATDQWNTFMDVPIAARSHLTAVTVGDKVYVGFGYDNSTSQSNRNMKDVWIFDPANKSWTELSIPFAGQVASSWMSVFAINGKAYFLAMGNGMWEYNPANLEWTSKKHISNFDFSYDPAFAIGSSAIVFSGGNRVFQYDSQRDEWCQRQSQTGNSRRGEIAAFAKGKVYYGLGNYTASVSMQDFWELTIE